MFFLDISDKCRDSFVCSLEEIASCGGVDILRVIKFVWSLFGIVCFLVPIGLIVMVSIDFAKNVMVGNTDEMKKNANKVLKRFIYCVAFFLVPTIVSFAINLLGENGVDYASCITIAKGADLSQYKSFDPIDEYPIDEPIFGGSDNTTASDNNDSTSSDTGSGSTGIDSPFDDIDDENDSTEIDSPFDDVLNKKIAVYIGDTRFYDMQMLFLDKIDVVWITGQKVKYDWLKKVYNKDGDGKLAKFKDTTECTMYINMGLYDLQGTTREKTIKYAKTYATLYKDIADKYKKCEVKVVSVNPIETKKAKENGYDFDTNDIIFFNSTLQQNLEKVSYCNIYSKILTKFKTTDGVLYEPETSKKIYNELSKCD